MAIKSEFKFWWKDGAPAASGLVQSKAKSLIENALDGIIFLNKILCNYREQITNFISNLALSLSISTSKKSLKNPLGGVWTLKSSPKYGPDYEYRRVAPKFFFLASPLFVLAPPFLGGQAKKRVGQTSFVKSWPPLAPPKAPALGPFSPPPQAPITAGGEFFLNCVCYSIHTNLYMCIQKQISVAYTINEFVCTQQLTLNLHY